MEMKLMNSKKNYLQNKCSIKVLVRETTTDFSLRLSKTYITFTCKFPMIMHKVLVFTHAAAQKVIS